MEKVKKGQQIRDLPMCMRVLTFCVGGVCSFWCLVVGAVLPGLLSTGLEV